MSGPRVTTTYGTVEGAQIDGCQRFLGIPYAKSPVGALRFAAPVAPGAHDGVLSVTTFAPHAPQRDNPMERFLSGGEMPAYDEASCLGLNVWTPSSDDAHRPVMVWIHGGGYVFGSASASIYDGSSFAQRHDVVVVSFNYRLGVLGFTHLADAFGGEFADSGSVGVLDAVAALEWVRDNIGRFGGDPDNVTIFGESAGAMSVGTLLAMPRARGLFHKAILASGAASTVRGATAAAEHFNELAELLGPDAASVDGLQSMSVERLLEAFAELSARHAAEGLISTPVVGTPALPLAPIDAVASGATKHVPLIIGTNRDEWRLFAISNLASFELDETSAIDAIGNLVDEDAKAAYAAYRERLGDRSPGDAVIAAHGDAIFRAPALRLANAHVGAGGVAFAYLFCWESPNGAGFLGACHGIEMPFVFNTLGSDGGQSLVGPDGPPELAESVHATWAKFARTGSPSHGPLGRWATYGLPARSTMVINTDSQVEDDPLGAERRLFAGT
jgi:para-nitrobenzyl esterase